MRSRENKAHSGNQIRFSLRHSDAVYVRVREVTGKTTGCSLTLSFCSINRCLPHKPQKRDSSATATTGLPQRCLQHTVLSEEIYCFASFTICLAAG